MKICDVPVGTGVIVLTVPFAVVVVVVVVDEVVGAVSALLRLPAAPPPSLATSGSRGSSRNMAVW